MQRAKSSPCQDWVDCTTAITWLPESTPDLRELRSPSIAGKYCVGRPNLLPHQLRAIQIPTGGFTERQPALILDLAPNEYSCTNCADWNLGEAQVQKRPGTPLSTCKDRSTLGGANDRAGLLSSENCHSAARQPLRPGLLEPESMEVAGSAINLTRCRRITRSFSRC